MGTIADKLAYTKAAREEIRAAIVEKGMNCPGDAPFCTFDDYIRNISSGGVGNATLYLTPSVDLLEGESTFIVHSDTELANNLDIGCFSLSDNVTDITLLDILNVQVTVAEAAAIGEEITMQAKPSAYKNLNGISEELVVTCRAWKIMDYLNKTDGMTNANYTSDDGSVSLSLDTLLYYYNDTAYNIVYISGNSWIGIGSSTEHIKFNRRDTYISTYYYQLIEAEDIKTMKIRWEGWTPYSSRTDPYKYIWECFIMETGDIFIALVHKGASANFDGTFTMYGQTYTISTNQPYVSFYRQNKEGTEWEIVYDKFDMEKSLQFYPLKVLNIPAQSILYSPTLTSQSDGNVVTPDIANPTTEFILSQIASTAASGIVVEPSKSIANTALTLTYALSTSATGILTE